MNSKYLIIIVSIITLAILIFGTNNVRADADEDGNEDHDHCMSEFWGAGWGENWVMPVVIGAVLIALLFFMILRTDEHGGSLNSQSNAANLAMDRYARGDIERNEYLRIIEDLKK